jgi:hypothetical protein
MRACPDLVVAEDERVGSQHGKLGGAGHRRCFGAGQPLRGLRASLSGSSDSSTVGMITRNGTPSAVRIAARRGEAEARIRIGGGT